MTLPSSKTRAALTWLFQLVAAAILVLTGVSKLTSAPDAVALFTQLGVEPWGRFLLGGLELLTAGLLLWPRSAVIGGTLGVVLMLGAIGTHLFRIGIMYGGGPSLFLMAVTVFFASAATIALRRKR